jgi:hypothetical protein
MLIKINFLVWGSNVRLEHFVRNGRNLLDFTSDFIRVLTHVPIFLEGLPQACDL